MKRYQFCIIISIISFVILFFFCGKKDHNGDTHSYAHAPDTISVASYNVENLFDFNDDGTEYPEYKPGACNWTEYICKKKFDNTASVIAALNADIIGLCEVENGNALDILAKALKAKGTLYPFSAIGVSSHKTVTCTALLSRLPITSRRAIDVPPAGDKYFRAILEADINFNGSPLKIFVNHWPSKEYPESQRIATAEVLEKRISELPAGTDCIVLGDFNSDYNECVTFHSFGLDNTYGKTGLNNVLGTVSSEPRKAPVFINEKDFIAGNNSGYFDPWLELPETRRMSTMYKGNNQTPDHILLPKALFDNRGISFLDSSFEPFTWNGRLLQKDGEPMRWKMVYHGNQPFHTGQGYSDHLPVLARFFRGPFRTDTISRDTLSNVKSLRASTTGFESSTEGWITCDRHFSLARDSLLPASGRYCLRIQGLSPKENRCAARVLIPCEASTRKLTIDLRGSGKISVRCRLSGEKWLYLNGPDFQTPSKSARYLSCSIRRWNHLSFSLDKHSSADIEVELRAGKDSPFCFWIDNVRVG